MAYDGSLIFDTKIDRSGFEKGVKQLNSISGKAFGAITKSVVAVGTALTGIVGISAKVGMNFEGNMSQVAATMGITADEINNGSKSFELLKSAAKEAGKTTKFSAGESAEALNYLALAGYDAEKSVQALPTVLNLAAAGNIDLAYASDMVTDSMSALGIETEELEGFVDELAKASQKSNTSVGQLGEAILTVGGTAKVLAGGTVELNTALGILADNGIKGAEGGTALRNMILSLSAPTDKAASKMKELGLEVFDAEGNMRPLNEVFQDLDQSLQDMTEGEKTQVLNTIFNKVDLKSANALLANSGDRFDELSEDIANADGAAANMAETLNNNLKGKIGLLGSALEGLGIEIYENIDTPFNDVVDTVIGYVDKLNDVFTAHDRAKEKMEELGFSAAQIKTELEDIPSGFEGAIVVLGDILADMIVKISEAIPKILQTSVEMMQSFIKGIKDNKTNIGNAVVNITTMLVETFFELIPELLDIGIDLILSLIDGMTEKLPELMTMAIDTIILISDKIIDNLPLIIDAGLKVLMSLIQGIIDNLPKLIAEVPRIINSFSSAIYDKIPTIIKTGIDILMALIKGLIDSIPTLIENIPQIIMAIVNVITLYNWMNLGKSIISNMGNGIQSMVTNITTTAKNLATNVIEGIKAIFSGGPKVGSGFITHIINGIKSMIVNIIGSVKGLATNIIETIYLIFLDAPNIGKNFVQGIWRGISNSLGWILDQVSGFAKNIADKFKDFFKIKSPSRLMAEYGVNIAEGLAVGIKEKKSVAEQAMYDMAQSIVKEYDRLGDAVISALKSRYREEERLELERLSGGLDNIKNYTRDVVAKYEEQFQAKLRALNVETSEEMKALQDQIDAINNKTKEEERELKEQEWNNKISLKEKEILEAKSNEERLKLQKQLNDLKAERQREQILEERQRQIEALRVEMQLVKEKGEEEREELEEQYNNKVEQAKKAEQNVIDSLNRQIKQTKEHYSELLQEERIQAEARTLILDENNQEMIELLEEYNPYWQNAGQSFGESLLIGLNSMRDSIEAEVAEILSLISEVERRDAQLANQNSIIIQAKKDYDEAKKRNDEKAMEEAHRRAEEARKAGGTISSEDTLDDALKMRNSVQSEMGRTSRAMTTSKETTINNDNGITQKVYFNQPVKSPSEQARQVKKVGKELILGY